MEGSNPENSGNGGGGGGADGGSTSIGFNLGFVKTPPGILLIVNLVILFLGWVVMAGWKGEFVVEVYSGRSGFFLAACLIPWMVFLIIFVLMMFNLHSRLSRIINFPVTLMINCVLWTILLFIASCIIADLLRKLNKWDGLCSAYKCGYLGACTAFGFFGCIGMGVQAFLHFREWKSP